MAKRSGSKKSAVAAPPRQHSLIWLQGLLCGAMATLATPTAVLLGVLLGPAMLALLFDGEPGRPRARSIALCSMAAAIDPLRTLWLAGHNLTTASALLGNFRVIATAWTAAAAGWLLAELTPLAVRAVLETLAITRTARLQADRDRLVEDWGLDTPAEADQ